MVQFWTSIIYHHPSYCVAYCPSGANPGARRFEAGGCACAQSFSLASFTPPSEFSSLSWSCQPRRRLRVPALQWLHAWPNQSFTESSFSNVLRPSSMSCSVDWYGQLEEPMREKNRAFMIVMQVLISMSCRAGLVTLLELLKQVLLLRVSLPFTFSVFLQLIFSFSLVLKPEQKLDTPLRKRGFTEDRAAGSSLFRRRSRSCLRERLFFLALFSSPGQNVVLTWTLRFSSFLSPPWPPSRPASQALWSALFLLPRWPSAPALIWRQFVHEKPKLGCWRLHRSAWLSGRLFLFPLATRRFHDSQLEPVLHVSLASSWHWRWLAWSAPLGCQFSGRSQMASAKLLATFFTKVPIVSSCNTWKAVLKRVRRSHVT